MPLAAEGVAVTRKQKRGRPPANLAKPAKERWRAVAPQLAKRAVDPALLATYCQVWVRWRQAEDALAKSSQLVKNTRGGVSPSPLIAIAHQAAGEVRALEDRLGISPAPASTSDRVKKRAPRPTLLTRRQLAEALSVHIQTITKWEREGLPIAERGDKGRPSKYREIDVRAWRRQREDAAKAKTDGPLNFMQARAHKEYWQGLLAEQQHQIRAKELLAAAEVEKVWGAEVAAIRTILLSIPVTYADRVHRASTLDGLSGVESSLKDVVHHVLRELEREDRPLPGVA